MYGQPHVPSNCAGLSHGLPLSSLPLYCLTAPQGPRWAPTWVPTADGSSSAAAVKRGVADVAVVGMAAAAGAAAAFAKVGGGGNGTAAAAVSE